MSFLNKVVLITGASSGIGAATAIKFVLEGANVAIVGRNKDKLKNVSELCGSTGSKLLVLQADVTNDEAVKRICNDVISNFGKLDILINNAGILSINSIMSENCMETFDNIMATNLRSAVYLTHLSAPHLIKTKGNIVNVSSVAGLRIALPHAFAYQTAKAALDHFTRSTALDLAPKGVRVNSVNPGVVRTSILNNVVADEAWQNRFFDQQVSSTPLGKVADPGEIADLIMFIVSDKAKSITGSSFVSDNGTFLTPALTSNFSQK